MLKKWWYFIIGYCYLFFLCTYSFAEEVEESVWSTWSQCNTTCGKGFETRWKMKCMLNVCEHTGDVEKRSCTKPCPMVNSGSYISIFEWPKTTALAFLGTQRFRRDADLNIYEECREKPCFYEEVREWIDHNHYHFGVCSWMQNKNCGKCQKSEVCKTVTRDCSTLATFKVKCVDPTLPIVSAELRNATNADEEIVQELFFKCTSEEIKSDGEFEFFKFYWFIDGNITHISNVVPKTNLSHGYFYEHNGITTLGIQIGCQYLALRSHDDVGKLSKVSINFFAGVKVLNEPVTVERGKEGVLLLQLTVPFGCLYDKEQKKVYRCHLYIEMRTQQYSDCDGINSNIICGTSFNNEEWNKVQTITLQHSDTLDYRVSSVHRIELHTLPMDHHPIWSNVVLPEIQIHVEDKNTEWKGKSCYSHSDPHMMTFDGISYDNQNAGTFIMYEGRDGQGNIMQVQTKLTTCNKLSGPGIFCNCGVAIRAAADVYIINRCSPEEFFFGFKNCRNGVLDVRKQDDFNYIIYFPTSTYVQLHLWTFQNEDVIEVNIFPSQFDDHVSKGLCSRLRSGALIDAYSKHHDEIQRPDDFSKSWRVGHQENLFELKESQFANFAPLKNNMSVCTCSGRLGELSHTMKCGKHLGCPKPNKHVYGNTCMQKEKRSTRSMFSFLPDKLQRKTNREKIFKRFAADIQPMSKEEARSYCENYMNLSRSFQLCRGIPNIDAEKAIESCILDIELTNTTLWAPASREGFKNLCKKELYQNNTLRDEENGQAMVDYLKGIMCPNECSGRGLCDNGTCKCDENFGGSDCSQDLSIPPDVFAINPESGGLCDLSDCEEAIVEGNMFLDRNELTCKMTRFQASVTNSKMFLETIVVSATHNHLAEVRCRIPQIKHKRSTFMSHEQFVRGYIVSISNNAKDYSSSHALYILDSTCQDTVNVSGQIRFVLKENYCFINGQCVPETAEYGLNNCYVCNTNSDTFAWSLNITKKGCKKSGMMQDGHSNLVIPLILSLAVLIVVVVVIVTGIKFRERPIMEYFANQPPPYFDAAKPKLRFTNSTSDI